MGSVLLFWQHDFEMVSRGGAANDLPGCADDRLHSLSVCRYDALVPYTQRVGEVALHTAAVGIIIRF